MIARFDDIRLPGYDSVEGALNLLDQRVDVLESSGGGSGSPRQSLGYKLIGLKQRGRAGVMAVPPAVTKSNTATSIVDASYTAGTVRYAPDVANTRLVLEGGEWEAYTVSGKTTLRDKHITDIDGSRTLAATPYRFRLITDAPSIDFCFQEFDSNGFTLAVDGELISRGNPFSFAYTEAFRYVNVNFGAGATTYGRTLVTIIPTAGGSNYAANDLITLDGGSGGAGGTPTVIRVTLTGVGGSVARARMETPGAYTALPIGTMSQASTTGSGTGCQIAATGWAPLHSTRRVRYIEGFLRPPLSFFGVVTAAEDIVLPWPASPSLPKLCVVGDSMSEGAYLDYPAGFIGYSIAQVLGLQDRTIISAQSGTGWNKDNGLAARWSNAHRITDFTRYAADIYLFLGSQNDTAGAALTTAVTSTLNQLLAARPNALIVGLPNLVGGDTAKAASIAAGFAAASDQGRVRFINAQDPQWLGSFNNTLWTVSSDAAHLSQSGHDMYAAIAAELIHQALLSMCFA